MRLEGYRLLAQVGVGPDGIAYQAQARGGDNVLVCVLSGARADGVRWPELTRRLKRAALLQHPAAVGVRDLLLDNDPPYVVLDAAGPATLARELRFRLPLPQEKAVALCRPLAAALAEAHRVGLVHSGVRPEAVLLPAPDQPRLDFTALHVGGPPGAELLAEDPSDDSNGLGRVLCWLLTGRKETDIPESLERSMTALLRELLAADAGERLPMRDAAARLDALLAPLEMTRAAEAVHAPVSPASDSALVGRQLGRFRLEEMLGHGGMGVVYRAVDTSDGRAVALKVLRGAAATNSAMLRRFHKEARLLAEVQSPHVVNLLEVNEDAGLPYLVLEFVAGRSLDRVLAERGWLPERAAVAILADVARGLAEAHARGIVHRDVKPENILLEGVQEGPDPFTGRAKLADFGLARHVVETESLNLTQAGAILGTLFYMSPEQCAGQEIDARADVYSMGATLFHLLAGRPPFVADRVLALIDQHTKEPPPPLRQFNPDVSDALCQLVAKALAKAPQARYPDAGALLEDLERLLRGEPTAIAVHPRRPACNPARVLCYEWTWDLEAAPEQLWPYVSNTERLNRAAGLTPVQFRHEVETDAKAPAAGGGLRTQRVRSFGSFRKAGIGVAWEEHPFEWIEARRMGVVREYAEGPFAWLMSVTELEPRGAGTRLVHRVELEPRGLLGRTLAAIEVGGRGRRSVERIYQRIDAILNATGAASRRLADAFEEPATLTRAQRQRLDRLGSELVRAGVVPEVAERLTDWVAHAAPQDVGRIRPLALARQLGLDPEAVVAACLHGARAGLFILLWDLICPLCRIPAAVTDTLRRLAAHEHCPACAEEFPLDFGSSVEMVFRAHPEVRTSELGTYCIGGPAHSPHVVAQVRVAAGERIELDLDLNPGAYRLRGPQLAYRLDFRVEQGMGLQRCDVMLTRPPAADSSRVLRAGSQVLVLTNDHTGELVVRIERVAPRADALTAARASALALFRELFPGEVLSPGQMVSVAAVTLLVTELEEPNRLYADGGDARAFAVLHELFGRLGDRARAGGGAVVKTVGEGVVASFADAEAAVRVGLDLPQVLAAGETTGGLCLRVGIHRGPALAATVNDQLDYFGTVVRQALALPAAARGGGLVLTQAVAGDSAVAALLEAAGGHGVLVETELPGAGIVPVLHLRFPKLGTAVATHPA
jgi:serine/threonine protein kinase/class 3 adenylate cyclase